MITMLDISNISKGHLTSRSLDITTCTVLMLFISIFEQIISLNCKACFKTRYFRYILIIHSFIHSCIHCTVLLLFVDMLVPSNDDDDGAEPLPIKQHSILTHPVIIAGLIPFSLISCDIIMWWGGGRWESLQVVISLLKSLYGYWVACVILTLKLMWLCEWILNFGGWVVGTLETFEFLRNCATYITGNNWGKNLDGVSMWKSV